MMTMVVVVLAVAGWWRHAVPDPIPSRGGRALQLRVAAVPFFRQGDPRWGGEQVGGSREPLAAVGCTVSCVAMALAQAGIPMDPGSLNQLLLAQGGYTASGLLRWRGLAAGFTPPLQVTFPDNDHGVMDDWLGRGVPVLARIRLGGGEGAVHWVLVVGKEGSDYLVHDPLLIKGPTILAQRSPIIEALRVITR